MNANRQPGTSLPIHLTYVNKSPFYCDFYNKAIAGFGKILTFAPCFS